MLTAIITPFDEQGGVDEEGRGHAKSDQGEKGSLADQQPRNEQADFRECYHEGERQQQKHEERRRADDRQCEADRGLSPNARTSSRNVGSQR